MVGHAAVEFAVTCGIYAESTFAVGIKSVFTFQIFLDQARLRGCRVDQTGELRIQPADIFAHHGEMGTSQNQRIQIGMRLRQMPQGFPQLGVDPLLVESPILNDTRKSGTALRINWLSAAVLDGSGGHSTPNLR